MRDPDGYLIEVGEYTKSSIAHFKEFAARKKKKLKRA
jgi:hypothetical protein